MDPESWPWIWLIVAVACGAGEIAIAGSFFLAPFAVAAAITALLAFVGVGVGAQWMVFVILSAALLLALRPLARRLDDSAPSIGIGSGRQIGQQARVIEAIDGIGNEGFVMLGAERWRAESADGTPIAEGTTVVVTEVRGTRVLVAPSTLPSP